MFLYVLVSVGYILLASFLFDKVYNQYLKLITRRHNNLNKRLKEEGKPHRELLSRLDIKSQVPNIIFVLAGLISLIYGLKVFYDLSLAYFIKNLATHQILIFTFYLIFKIFINRIKDTKSMFDYGVKGYKRRKKDKDE